MLNNVSGNVKNSVKIEKKKLKSAIKNVHRQNIVYLIFVARKALCQVFWKKKDANASKSEP